MIVSLLITCMSECVCVLVCVHVHNYATWVSCPSYQNHLHHVFALAVSCLHGHFLFLQCEPWDWLGSVYYVHIVIRDCSSNLYNMWSKEIACT